MLIAFKTNYAPPIVTETWLGNSIFNNELLPTNYTLYRYNRHSHGGGVLIALTNRHVPSKQFLKSTEIEFLTIELENSLNILVSGLSNPPLQQESFVQAFSSALHVHCLLTVILSF